MANTTDQQYSNATGGIMGLASVQSYSGAAAHNPREFPSLPQKNNIDRSALLEEIEKSKVEEIKLKTLRNLEKYAKQNGTTLSKFTNAPTIKNVPMMNTTTCSNTSKGNPFARSASKMGSRSNAKSRSGVNVIES